MKTYKCIIIDTHSPIFDTMCKFQGDYYSSWLNLWNSIEDKKKEISSHPVYTLSWLAHFGIPKNIFKLGYIYQKEQLVCVIPIKVINTSLKQYYVSIPHNDQSYGISFCAEQKHIMSAIDTLLAKRITYNKKPLLIEGKKIDQSNTLLSSKKIRLLKFKSGQRSIIDVSKSYDNVYNRYSKNFKNKIKQYTKKLNQLSEVKIEQNNTNFESMYKIFLEIEGSGWKGKEGTAIKCNPATKGFFHMMTKGFYPLGMASFYILKAEDSYLASNLCINSNNTTYLYKIAYNEKFNKVSPGTILFEEQLKTYCDNSKLETVNLVSDQEWHSHWAPEKVKTYSIFMIPNSPRLVLSILLGMNIKNFLKTMRELCR